MKSHNTSGGVRRAHMRGVRSVPRCTWLYTQVAYSARATQHTGHIRTQDHRTTGPQATGQRQQRPAPPGTVLSRRRRLRGRRPQPCQQPPAAPTGGPRQPQEPRAPPLPPCGSLPGPPHRSQTGGTSTCAPPSTPTHHPSPFDRHRPTSTPSGSTGG